MKYVAAGPTLHLADRGPGLLSRLPPGYVRLTRDGRSALAWALERLVTRRTSRVAVPAYICRSVVSGLDAVGFAPAFYAVSDTLEPDLDHVKQLLDDGVDAVLAVHYFGCVMPSFDALCDLAREHGAAIVEDCAHALFSRDRAGNVLGAVGDAAVFSFRKSLPVPEGGAVVAREAIDPGRRSRRSREWVALGREITFRADATLAGFGWSPRTQLARSGARARYTDAADERTIHVDDSIGTISQRLIRHVDPAAVVERRRANFTSLLGALPPSDTVHPVLPELPTGACPVGLPLYVADREHVVSRLLARGVQPRVFWESLPDDAAELVASRLRDELIILPVHQDLPGVAMATVAAALVHAAA